MRAGKPSGARPLFCDEDLAKCSEPVPVPKGHKLCSDGLSTCPVEKECNLEGKGDYRCLLPGSTRCELGHGLIW